MACKQSLIQIAIRLNKRIESNKCHTVCMIWRVHNRPRATPKIYFDPNISFIFIWFAFYFRLFFFARSFDLITILLMLLLSFFFICNADLSNTVIQTILLSLCFVLNAISLFHSTWISNHSPLLDIRISLQQYFGIGAFLMKYTLLLVKKAKTSKCLFWWHIMTFIRIWSEIS